MSRTVPNRPGGHVGHNGQLPQHSPDKKDPNTGSSVNVLGPADQALYDLFAQYGLDSLAKQLLKFVQQGLTGASLDQALRATQEFKDRFAGMDQHLKNFGTGVSISEYLSLEAGYRDAMVAAGLPKGFYDDPSDFANFIGQGKSVAEINARVQAAVTAAKNTDPGYRQMLKSTFGIALSDGDIAAYMLNPERALPVVQRQVDAFAIADAQRRQGLQYSATRAEQLAQLGVTGDAANQAFGSIAETTTAFGRAADAFGLDYSQANAEDEVLLGSASAKRKREQVQNAFSAYNSGQSSTATKSAFGKDASSSY